MRYFILLFALISIVACEPQVDDKISLGEPPSNVSFSITPDTSVNSFILTNTTPNTFLQRWDFGNGITAEGEEVTAFYQDMGTYVITLTAFNDAGHALGSQSIDIDEDAPAACNPGSLMEYLTNCETRTWKLSPEEGALFVGPSDGSATWWQSSADVPAERPCAWDDEWIFTPDGKVVYDTKGDIWAEDYMGFNFECIDETLLPDNLSAWASGEHAFILGPESISLVGNGAFIGLPKVANGAEVTSPQSGVTYTVTDMTTDADGNDLIVLSVLYNGDTAVWRFTLRAEN